MGAGRAFRRLSLSQGRQLEAEAIAIHEQRVSPEPLRSGPRTAGPEDAALPGEQPLPPSWGRRTSGPRLSRKGSGVLVPRLCAPERRQFRADCPYVAPICRASGCKRLRGPEPAPPAAPRPEAPAATRPGRTLRPARSCGRARAAPAAAPTRARRPSPLPPDTPRPRAAPSCPRRGQAEEEATAASRRGRDGAAAKPEPRSAGTAGGARGSRDGAPRPARVSPPRGPAVSVRGRGGRGAPGSPSAPSARQPALQPKFPQVPPAETAPLAGRTRCRGGGGDSHLPARQGPPAPAARRPPGWACSSAAPGGSRRRPGGAALRRPCRRRERAAARAASRGRGGREARTSPDAGGAALRPRVTRGLGLGLGLRGGGGGAEVCPRGSASRPCTCAPAPARPLRSARAARPRAGAAGSSSCGASTAAASRAPVPPSVSASLPRFTSSRLLPVCPPRVPLSLSGP